MLGRENTPETKSVASPVPAVLRLFVLSIPGFLLAYAHHRVPPSQPGVLLVGATCQAVLCLFYLFWRNPNQRTLGPWIITTYLIAFAWFSLADEHEDPFHHLTKGFLVLLPILAFSLQWLQDSGAPAMRRANRVAARLANRTDWPDSLEACRQLPIVQEFRDSIYFDAAPALALLQNPRAEIRMTALSALEFRKSWKAGQPEMILAIAQGSDAPAIRAAALKALGNIERRELIETLAGFLQDPIVELRKAAVESLFWDLESRWQWLRFQVRRTLANPALAKDGELLPEHLSLSADAQNDLIAWCSEKGLLAARAAQTLAAQFRKALAESPAPKFVESLRDQLLNAKNAAVYRIELGRLLQEACKLTEPTLDQLMQPSNPASLRLIACETVLLDFSTHRILQHSAVHTLREVGRLPNREISLATASILQRRLGLDMGLGQEMPALQSKQAADVNRRVLQWANQQARAEDSCHDDSQLLEQSGAVRY